MVMLDLRAVFDSVDHGLMLNRLETLAGLNGTVLEWSYLVEWTIGSYPSDQVAMTWSSSRFSFWIPSLQPINAAFVLNSTEL